MIFFLLINVSLKKTSPQPTIILYVAHCKIKHVFLIAFLLGLLDYGGHLTTEGLLIWYYCVKDNTETSLFIYKAGLNYRKSYFAFH